MASLSTSADGSRRIQFSYPATIRRTLHLGKLDLKASRSVTRMVELLVTARTSGMAPPDEAARWLASLSPTFRKRLVGVALLDPLPEEVRPVVRLGAFLDDYLAKRQAVLKPATQQVYRGARDAVVTHLGPDRDLTTITEADMEDFRAAQLASGLGPNTVARRCGAVKMFLRHAVRARIIDRNPAEVLKGNVRANREAFRFVTREDIARVIAACPDAEWRLLVALSRFGGLRCPSESTNLTWGDIDWERGRMRVPSPKTAHHAGHESRMVPIFPELKPHLEAAFDAAEPGTTHCIARYRDKSSMGAQFRKIVKRAGVEPWPRLWHNLRATRQTELSATFPSHVVCGWLGNSAAIAAEHYLRTTDDDFAKAAAVPTGPVLQRATGDADSDADRDRHEATGAPIASGDPRTDDAETTGIAVPSLPVASVRDARGNVEGVRALTAGTGTRSSSSPQPLGTSSVPADAPNSGVGPLYDSDASATDSDLAAVIAAWPGLSADVRAAILALVEPGT